MTPSVLSNSIAFSSHSSHLDGTGFMVAIMCTNSSVMELRRKAMATLLSLIPLLLTSSWNFEMNCGVNMALCRITARSVSAFCLILGSVHLLRKSFKNSSQGGRVADIVHCLGLSAVVGVEEIVCLLAR